MKLNPHSLSLMGIGLAVFLTFLGLHGDEPAPRVGPQTEKRFPPLKVPAGFKATLFACDPLIEYPSVLSAGPRPGAIFVAIDYVTGLGTEIVRRDEIRLVEDTDGDGYADKATVYARGFNSIQGLAYHDDTLYVMHAPFLTALRDTKGTGTADERRDLLTGLGLTPEENKTRLHCANGVVVGHDGWLYLALGDNGIDVPRPEGDRLVLHGGGILRCRPDGRDLHVFATGLRNIYDVALDAELNVFVRDNENDGGTYMIRVCHSFHGADHGYPYLYEERPDEALLPLADLGRGSSAGGVCYRETQFPPEYRGNLFFCEWGRSVVRYQPRPRESGFAPVQEVLFAESDANDPYGFKPTDIVVQRDGTLMVSDWADGQRPKRGRGRIYHIAHADAQKLDAANQAVPFVRGIESSLQQLDAESYSARWEAQRTIEQLGSDGLKAMTEALRKGRLGVRGRLHVVWAVARLEETRAVDALLQIAGTDSNPAVRVQAMRAVADLSDPVLTRHRLDAGPGDAALAERLAVLGKGQDRRVLREVVITLGRLRWAGLPDWLRQNLGQPDAALTHAAMQALRRSGSWPAILKLLDEPGDTPLRAIALRAIAGSFEPKVVDDLLDRLARDTDSERRRAYADALTRVAKKPGPWVYWGYRPGLRPANAVAWERTEVITQALDRVLADPDRELRLFVLRRMMREKVPARLASLTGWLRDEHQPDRVAFLLASLREQPVAEARRTLETVILDRQHTAANRLEALAIFTGGIDADPAPLLILAQALEDGPVLADALRRTARYRQLPSTPLLANKLSSADAEVRASAIEALGELRSNEHGERVLSLLQDSDARVRRAAAEAAGKLEVRQAIEPLLKRATDTDSAVRRACLDSLRQLREPRVVPLAVTALSDRDLELKALECLGELGGPEQIQAVASWAKHNPSTEALSAAMRALNAWGERERRGSERRQAIDRSVAEVHGSTGICVRWQAQGTPVPGRNTPGPAQEYSLVGSPPFHDGRTLFATGTEGRVVLATKSNSKATWLAYTEVTVAETTPVEFLASSSGSLHVWLNGKTLHQREQVQDLRPDSDRFEGTLSKGENRLLVQMSPASATVQFQLRFRRRSGTQEQERLTQAVLSRTGNPERGRQLFFNTEKSLCLKCHRLGSQGETIGPELTGVGSRFSRISIVESILEPSRTIAPSFGTLVLTLKNGRTLTGVKIAESEKTLTLADNQGQKQIVVREEIEEQQVSPQSTMPEGLEKRFTEAEFIDLIAFLVSQKKS